MNAPLLARASLRFYRQHPAQLVLTLLGVALGAAVVVAVALANRAALASFDRSVAALAGPMSHEILSRFDADLDESLYRELRLQHGQRQVLPVVEVQLQRNDRHLRLTGIDPLALTATSTARPAAWPASLSLGPLMTENGAVLLPHALAESLQVAAGDRLPVQVAGREEVLQIIGVGEPGVEGWFDEVLLADIAVAQDLAGRRGRLDRILLRLDEDAALALRAQLPQDVELREFDQRRRSFAAMTRAFRINLTAMSLLAVLIGAFLVFNAMSFAVIQRRETFASLRLLGVTARQLERRLLIEALCLGSAGALLGSLLGLALGQSLLLLVTRTVSDLYVQISPLQPDLPLPHWLAACAVTLLAVLIATLAPASAAARIPPVGLLREPVSLRAGSPGPWLLGSGGLMLACPLVILFSGGSLVAGFVALFLLVLGYSLLVPPLALGLLRLLQRRSVAAGAAWRALVLRGVERALPRLAPAIVALTVAVSATVGVAIMIDSFRDSVARWLETTLRGDIYVYAEGSAERLDERWLTDLRSMPGVRQVTAGRLRTLTLGGERTRTLLLDGAAAGLRGFDLLAGPPDAARQVFDANTGILVSEPLARRRDLELGDRLLLETPDGEQSLPILGIYRDYGSSRGQALMGYGLYARHWRDRAVSTLSLQLLPGVDGDALRRRIEAYAEARQRPVAIVSAQAIRDRSLDVFDRTFAVTEVLRALVVVVAFVGIVSALLALFLERRREFAVLRAVGMTPAQLLRLLLGQAGVSGLLAGLLALPLGVLLSVVLIDVINRRSFGWSLDTQLDPLLMLQAVALATFAALLAALLPARRLAAAELRAALEMP